MHDVQSHWSLCPHVGWGQPYRASSYVFFTRSYQFSSPSVPSGTIRWPPGPLCVPSLAQSQPFLQGTCPVSWGNRRPESFLLFLECIPPTDRKAMWRASTALFPPTVSVRVCCSHLFYVSAFWISKTFIWFKGRNCKKDFSEDSPVPSAPCYSSFRR